MTIADLGCKTQLTVIQALYRHPVQFTTVKNICKYIFILTDHHFICFGTDFHHEYRMAHRQT